MVSFEYQSTCYTKWKKGTFRTFYSWNSHRTSVISSRTVVRVWYRVGFTSSSTPVAVYSYILHKAAYLSKQSWKYIQALSAEIPYICTRTTRIRCWHTRQRYRSSVDLIIGGTTWCRNNRNRNCNMITLLFWIRFNR